MSTLVRSVTPTAALAAILMACSVAFTTSAEEVVVNAEELRRLDAEVLRVERLDSSTLSPAIRRADSAIDRSRITDLSTVTGTGTGSRVSETAPEWRLQPGEYMALKVEGGSRTLPCTIASGQCSQTEFRYLAFDEAGSRLDLSLDVEADSNLRYDTDEKRYESSLFVKLTDQASPGTIGDIDGMIQVVISAPVDSVTPGEILNMEQTNFFQAVELSVRDPEEPTVVRLAPSSETDPYVLDLGVTRPELVVSGPSSILGFGLEAATITIRIDGIDEPPTGAIVLQADGGLGESSVVLNGSGTATTTLRSRSTGQDMVSASLNPFADGQHRIEYVMPWSWLVSVLLGSLVGIAIRVTMRRRDPQMPGDTKFDIGIGLVGGFMGALLYALGINIANVPMPSGYSEAVTLAMSALGGWVFPKWLSGLGKAKPDQENEQ